MAHVADDPRVVAAIVARMKDANEPDFERLVNLLDSAGQWRRTAIPNHLWLRWLNRLAGDDDFEVRILAAQYAADMVDRAADPRVPALLESLIQDEHEDVRYNSLIAVAELAGSLGDRNARVPYESLAFTATQDQVPAIAAQAWIILGLLDPIQGFQTDWRNQPPQVARAILWASLTTNPHNLAPAIEALEDPAVDPTIRAMATYLLQTNPPTSETDLWLQTITPQKLDPLFISAQSAVRDVACMVASEQFTKEQNAELIAFLLNNYNDHAKMSGAILAGLTGLQHDLLMQKYDDEDIWAVQQIMQLGRWMQASQLPTGMNQQASNLLSRHDLPTTTILLAMLHQHQPNALDYLLNPRGEPRVNLVELLSRSRWWIVLQTFLPHSAPPFDPAADPNLQQFQIDVLRNWYLVNRHTLWQKPVQ